MEGVIVKTIKIDIDDNLLKKYRTDQLESFLKEQLKRLEDDDLLYPKVPSNLYL